MSTINKSLFENLFLSSRIALLRSIMCSITTFLNCHSESKCALSLTVNKYVLNFIRSKYTKSPGSCKPGLPNVSEVLYFYGLRLVKLDGLDLEDVPVGFSQECLKFTTDFVFVLSIALEDFCFSAHEDFAAVTFLTHLMTS